VPTSFNSEQFLQTKGKGELDTKRPVVPVGTYRAQIEKIDARENEIKKGDKKGQTVVFMDVLWHVLDERLAAALNIEKVFVRQSFAIDLTPEGNLDYGKAKNIDLGKLRAALKQNDAKKEWWPNLMVGALGQIQVTHDANEDDPTQPYQRVKSVAPLA